MSTSRPFAYNTGFPISGTDQIGDLAIATDMTKPYEANYGGVQWWEGPDEELGYVICKPISAGNQPNPVGIPCYIGFERSNSLTDQSFLDLANVVFPGNNFSTAANAKSWMDSNGYWTSWTASAPGGPGWEFYYAEGPIGATPPPFNNGDVIFFDQTAGTITYDPNYPGGAVNFNIYFNVNQADGTSYLTQFNTLDNAGGTIAISQAGNTAIYTGNASTYTITNFGGTAGSALVINAQIATLVQPASSPFTSGTPITVAIS
jgi:hypothetical protein